MYDNWKTTEPDFNEYEITEVEEMDTCQACGNEANETGSCEDCYYNELAEYHRDADEAYLDALEASEGGF